MDKTKVRREGEEVSKEMSDWFSLSVLVSLQQKFGMRE